METPADLALLEENPIRVARRSLNLSLHEIAHKSGINYQTWYLTERGCYDKIPGRILEFVVDNSGFSEFWIRARYSAFVTGMRARFKQEFHYDYESLRTCRTLEQVCNVLGVSRTQLAKLLCVQPAVLYKFDAGIQRRLPSQFVKALAEVGMPEYVILNLEKGR